VIGLDLFCGEHKVVGSRCKVIFCVRGTRKDVGHVGVIVRYIGEQFIVKFVHSTRTKMTCDKSTQLHDAFIGRARQRRGLIGCGETRTVHL